MQKNEGNKMKNIEYGTYESYVRPIERRSNKKKDSASLKEPSKWMKCKRVLCEWM